MPKQIGKEAQSYDIKTTVARRFDGKPPLSPEERVKRVVNLAAAASRRKRLDILVKYLETEVGHSLAATQRQYLHLIAGKFWGALSSTRGRLGYVRLNRMARVVGEGVAAHILSEKDVRLVRDRVVELFANMERVGAFGAEPAPPKPRSKPTWTERQMRLMTPEMLARQANISEGLMNVMAVIQTNNRPANEWVSWYNWLTLLASAAYDTRPGTPMRDKVLEDALKDRPDQDLARQFAALALDGLDWQLRRK